jgi:hypothetical protein
LKRPSCDGLGLAAAITVHGIFGAAMAGIQGFRLLDSKAVRERAERLHDRFTFTPTQRFFLHA